MKCNVDYHVVDLDESAGLLFLTGNHHTFAVNRGLADRLRQGFNHLTTAERTEWECLRKVGLVSDENPEVLRHSTFKDGADLAININLTNICNLACTYCFAAGGDYGRITEAMDHSSIDHIFAFIAEHLTPSRSVRLEFFGGEPLANFPIMREVCQRAEQSAAEHGIRYIYRISTNLTLLPTGVLDLFDQHRFIVSVSIDGGPAVQDANRPAKGGRGSYDRVMKNIQAVRQASEDVTLVARMTVAQHQPTLVENVRALWELNVFDYFQIYPGVFPARAVEEEPDSQDLHATRPAPVLVQISPRPAEAHARAPGPQTPGCSTGPETTPSPRHINFFLQEGMTEQFRDFLRAYPDLFTEGNRFKGVLEYERTLQFVLEGQLALAFCSGGRTYFTHSPDHSISPCHRLVGEPQFDVGTGSEGLTRTPDDWRLPVNRHPVCGQCWARYLCGGGCKQENYVASGDINVLNDESCRYQLLLAEEVLRMMGRSGAAYRRQDRSRFDELFVSCGRPVATNGRAEPDAAILDDFTHFRPLVPRY